MSLLPVLTRTQPQIHHRTGHSFHDNEVSAFYVVQNATAIVLQHIAGGTNATQLNSHEKEFVLGQIVLPGKSYWKRYLKCQHKTE